jgi:hypothetical protein
MLSKSPRVAFSLECPICLEHYDLDSKVPHVLSCGHTFCRSCLPMFFNNGSAQCPMDLRKHIYGDIKNIGINYLILEEINAPYKKDLCLRHNNLQRFFCNDHKSLMCQDCVAYDCIYKQHHLIAFEEITRVEPLKKRIEKLMNDIEGFFEYLKLLEPRVGEKNDAISLAYSRYVSLFKEDEKLKSERDAKKMELVKFHELIRSQRRILFALREELEESQKRITDNRWKEINEDDFHLIVLRINSLKALFNENNVNHTFREFQRKFDFEKFISNLDEYISSLEIKHFIFEWKYPAETAYVTGSWCNWIEKIPLILTNGQWVSKGIPLPRGNHQYKFIIDEDKWYFDIQVPHYTSSDGTTNNFITI